MHRGLPPDPEWSRLERLVLPFVYHGLSRSSALVFGTWCFLVAGFAGVITIVTLVRGQPALPLATVVVSGPACLLLLLCGEALRRHAARLRRHDEWRDDTLGRSDELDPTDPDPDPGPPDED